ncbi:MAG: BTAD domain-containing putative transcriptional regulator [Nitriliruptorales bacterium]
MQPLRVHLFGGFGVERGADPLPPIPSRAGRTLFSYLIVHRHRAHARDELAGIFWPELSESRARRRLSHTLWQIQDSLGELGGDHPYLEASSETLAFNRHAPYWLDVEEFERLLDTVDGSGTEAETHRRLRHAVDLYRGDFLSGYYDDWVLTEQERLGQRHLAALSQLMEIGKREREYEEALTYARRLTHHDPLREDAHREVMRLCVLLGRTSEALAQYERCRSVLLEDLGAEPAAATRDLYERITLHRWEGPRTKSPETESTLAEIPFVDRERERALLIDRLDAAFAGEGGLVLVEGDPGSGKTRLLSVVTDDAAWRGLSVLWGTAGEVGGPYAPLVAALEDGLSPLRAEQLGHRLPAVWLDEVGRLVPRLRGNRASDRSSLVGLEGAHRMREALASVIVELGRIGPTILVVEDVHWATEESLDVLANVVEQLDSTRLLLVLSYQGNQARERSEIWSALRAIDRIRLPERILLDTLTPDGVSEIVRAIAETRDVDGDLVARLHRETGGNPLFLVETLRRLVDAQELDSLVRGSTETAQLPLARSVQDVIAAQIATLTPDVRQTVETAAVIDHGIDVATLLAVNDLPADRTLAALEALVRSGLLAEDDEAYSFRHEQVRRATYDSLEPEARRLLHGRLAESLALSSPERVDLLAHHFSNAGLGRKAIHFRRLAAAHAESIHAYPTAARHLRDALDWLDRTPSTLDVRWDVLAEYERILGTLGRRDEQEAVLDRMTTAAVGSRQRETDVAVRRAWFLANTDHFEEAIEFAEAALTRIPVKGHAAAKGDALTALGTTLVWMGRGEEAVPHLEAAVEAYGPKDERAVEALVSLGNVLRELQRYDEAAETLTTATARSEERGDLRAQARALGALGAVLMERGDITDAEEAYNRAIEICRKIGYRHGEGVAQINLANLLYVSGRPAGALANYTDARVVLRGLRNRRVEAWARANAASLLHRVLGRDDEAQEEATSALTYFRDLGDRGAAALCLETLAGVARRRGRLEDAAVHLDRAIADAEADGDRFVATELQRRAIELALAAGEPERALQAAADALATCDEFDLPDLATSLRSLRSSALLAVGRIDGARLEAERAVAALRPGVEEAHLVHFRHHEALHASGDHAAAMRALERAHESLISELSDLSEDDRTTALSAVPEHREIVELWEAKKPRLVRVRLAAADAPRGRRLRNEELRDIVLTVRAPEDDEVAERIPRRRARLSRLLEEATSQGAAPTIADLAELLDVSPATVRRDLEAIRGEKQVPATRGRNAV